MNLSVIIVNYNVKEFVENLLHSIAAAVKGITAEVIIVDNASSDGSVPYLREKFPGVHIIANTENLGFSKANNIGLRYASGDYLLLLNPDTIVQEDTFTTMLAFFKQHPDAGLAGCKVLSPDGSFQVACRRSFPGPWTSFTKVSGLSALFPNSRLFARYNLTYLDENKTYEVDALSGSFMMFSRQVYTAIGGLDEQFFMYGEDLDFCYRVQKAGFKVFYVHSTTIIHYKGESTRRSSLDETRIFYNAMHLFVRKHLSSSLLVELILRSAIVIRELLAFLGKRRLVLFPLLTDAAVFTAALYAAEHAYQAVRPWGGFPQNTLTIVYSVPLFIHLLASLLAGVYRKTFIPVGRTYAGLLSSFLLLAATTFFFKDFAYSRGVLLLFYALLAVLLPAWKVVARIIGIGIPPDSGQRLVTLVVGNTDAAVALAAQMQAKYTAYHNVIGLISPNVQEVGTKTGGFTVLGATEHIPNIIRANNVNEVVFASGALSYTEMMSVVAKCQGEQVEFKVTGSDRDYIVGKRSVSLISDLPLIALNFNIAVPENRFVKRAFDVALALLLLPLTIPAMFFKKSVADGVSLSGIILSSPAVLSGKYSFVGVQQPARLPGVYIGRQGVTGMWYVETGDKENTGKLDIFYAKNQNLWLDLEILAKTLNKLIVRRT